MRYPCFQAERERLRAIVRRQVAEVAVVTEADEGVGLLGDKVRGLTVCGLAGQRGSLLPRLLRLAWGCWGTRCVG